MGLDVLAKMTVLTGKSSAHAEEVNAIEAVGAHYHLRVITLPSLTSRSRA
jgi:hypothetical protein